MTELHWIVDPSPACFHAVDLLLREQKIGNDVLANGLEEPAAALARELHADAIARTQFLANLIPQSVTAGGNRQLASIVLTKTIGARRTDQRINRITEILTQLESAFEKAMPDFVEQTRTNSAALVEPWHDYGQTLMRSVQRLVEEGTVVERADVLLMPPLQNGGGAAHLHFNSVRIEVLPAGTATDVPEVVRVAWLVAQLNSDLPMYQGELHRDRLAEIAAFAMLPAVVTAAVDLELVSQSPNPIETVLRSWRLESSERPDLADKLTRWWETWQSQRPKWSIALAALDQLLA